MTTIYLIPVYLDENVIETIPVYVLDAIKKCNVFFVENEKTARRFLKKLDKNIVIDDFEWFTIDKNQGEPVAAFRQKVEEKKTIGIMSEAGCPGVADPGQKLVSIAQEMNCRLKPLVGPNSLLLALMASGLNGQHFEFVGYLPIESAARNKSIKEIEATSAKNNSTQVFIETPYRNNQMVDSLISQCRKNTRLCIAVNITGTGEKIMTREIGWWEKNKPDIHKQPAIFLLQAGGK